MLGMDGEEELGKLSCHMAKRRPEWQETENLGATSAQAQGHHPHRHAMPTGCSGTHQHSSCGREALVTMVTGQWGNPKTCHVRRKTRPQAMTSRRVGDGDSTVEDPLTEDSRHPGLTQQGGLECMKAGFPTCGGAGAPKAPS